MSQASRDNGFRLASGDHEIEAEDVDEDEDEDEEEDHQTAAQWGRRDNNPFFRPPGGPEEPRKGRVYAAVEVPEPLEEEPIYMECLDIHWAHSVGQQGWRELYRSAPLSVVELTEYKLPEFPEGSQPGEIVWFELGYEPASGRGGDARLYTNLSSRGTGVKVSFHEPRPRGWAPCPAMKAGHWVQHTHMQPSQDRGLGAVERLLNGVPKSSGIATYDVGQGSCHAVLDNRFYIPSLYVDFGGGVFYNVRTFPDALRGFCFSQKPPIILTHWDWDHWSSVRRSPQALHMPWIAPPPPDKPIQQTLAAELEANGVLYTWDATFPDHARFGNILIEKCTGRTQNDSGLAVTVYPSALGRRKCLLPGDASYRYIPSVVANEKFNVVCMTHHGGRLHSDHYPLAKRGAVAVNSAGPRNSYRHPLFATLDAHIAAGWKLPVQTGTAGQRPCHILVPWGKSPSIFQGGCHGGECAVAIAKAAPNCASIVKLANPLPKKAKKAKVPTARAVL